jgi:exodeoxyribonuclease V beta subunit
VAGDSDAGVTLVESLDGLTTEIVDDLYLAHFGQDRHDPVLAYKDALRLAREVVNHPSTELRPEHPEPDSRAAVYIGFAKDVFAELNTRKRARHPGLRRPADPVGRRAESRGLPDPMHRRWPIVMVDEFQDTDLVQWQVIDRHHRPSTDRSRPEAGDLRVPRRDIVTYLKAAQTAGDKQTLGTNWRSDGALVDRLQGCVAPSSATRGSWCTTSTPITAAAGSPARRAATRYGCGWSNGRRSAAAAFRT